MATVFDATSNAPNVENFYSPFAIDIANTNGLNISLVAGEIIANGATAPSTINATTIALTNNAVNIISINLVASTIVNDGVAVVAPHAPIYAVTTAAGAIINVVDMRTQYYPATSVVSSTASAIAAAASAAAALVSANNAAADLVLTNADVVLTHADVVLTHADVVLTHADAIATALDAIATAADKVACDADAVATAADRVQTGIDAAAAAASAASINVRTINYQNAAYTILTTDRNKLIEYGGAGGHTYSLPTIATIGGGFEFHVKHVGAGVLTIDANAIGGTTIDGVASITLSPEQSIVIVADGTNNHYEVTQSRGYALLAAASTVSFTPVGSIIATDVQAALAELDTEKAALAGSASQTFSAAASTAAAHAVNQGQFEGWATFLPTVTADAGTFGSPTVNTARQMKIGKLLYLTLYIQASVATGSPTQFRVTLPSSLSCPSYSRVPVRISNNGAINAGQCILGLAGLETYAIFSLDSSAAFDGAGPTIVTLNTVVEVS